MKIARPIILVAGGTGGHVFPAQALASELCSHGYKVILITEKRGEAFQQMPATVFVKKINVGRFNTWFIIKPLFNILIGFLQSLRFFRQVNPYVIVGFGGYSGFPVLLAATLLGIPIVLHEQNAILGRVNRLFANRARTIVQSFSGTQQSEVYQNVVHTGTPVRKEFYALREKVDYQLLPEEGPIRLLIIGGSQGAQIFSDIIPVALSLLPDAIKFRLQVTQQCRKELLEKTKNAFEVFNIKANVSPFFQNISDLLANTHLVISRSGASTIAELTFVGRPAILVPYPWAPDGHQLVNAKIVQECDGAWIILQEDFNKTIVSQFVHRLITKPKVLLYAAERMRYLSEMDALEKLRTSVTQFVD
jgi:UDP-N-acetylglucosamine--N-acetylmuramyl-(pentapeptide) pyrophosphoryl-undecaprenol N-acetylglucosamine transferase